MTTLAEAVDDDNAVFDDVNYPPVNLMTDTDYSPEVRAEVIAALRQDPFYGPLLKMHGADYIVGNGGRQNCHSDIDRFMPLTAAKLTALCVHHDALGCFRTARGMMARRLDSDVAAFLARFAEHVAGDEPALKDLIVGVAPDDWPWEVIEWVVCWHERKNTGSVIDVAPVIETPQSVEGALNRIREQKKIRYEQQKRSDPHTVERYRRRNSASDQRMHDAILAGMHREPDRKHAKHELEAYADMAGLNYRAVPFHLTCMVAQGKIERVHYGWYRLPH